MKAQLQTPLLFQWNVSGIGAELEFPPRNFDALLGGGESHNQFLDGGERNNFAGEFVFKSSAGKFPVVPFEVPGQAFVRESEPAFAARWLDVAGLRARGMVKRREKQCVGKCQCGGELAAIH